MQVQFGGVYRLNVKNTTPQHDPEQIPTYERDLGMHLWGIGDLIDYEINGKPSPREKAIDEPRSEEVRIGEGKNAQYYALIDDEQGKDATLCAGLTESALSHLDALGQTDAAEQKRRAQIAIRLGSTLHQNAFARTIAEQAIETGTVKEVVVPVKLDPSKGYTQRGRYYSTVESGGKLKT